MIFDDGLLYKSENIEYYASRILKDTSSTVIGSPHYIFLWYITSCINAYLPKFPNAERMDLGLVLSYYGTPSTYKVLLYDCLNGVYAEFNEEMSNFDELTSQIIFVNDSHIAHENDEEMRVSISIQDYQEMLVFVRLINKHSDYLNELFEYGDMFMVRYKPHSLLIEAWHHNYTYANDLFYNIRKFPTDNILDYGRRQVFIKMKDCYTDYIEKLLLEDCLKNVVSDGLDKIKKI